MIDIFVQITDIRQLDTPFDCPGKRGTGEKADEGSRGADPVEYGIFLACGSNAVHDSKPQRRVPAACVEQIRAGYRRKNGKQDHGCGKQV